MSNTKHQTFVVFESYSFFDPSTDGYVGRRKHIVAYFTDYDRALQFVTNQTAEAHYRNDEDVTYHIALRSRRNWKGVYIGYSNPQVVYRDVVALAYYVSNSGPVNPGVRPDDGIPF